MMQRGSSSRDESAGERSGEGNARGELGVSDDLYPVVYEELKRIARHHLRGPAASDTLSTTELVHEAFLKLARGSGASWESRSHFFGAASRAMRQVLVDFARRRNAAKRDDTTMIVSQSGNQDELQLELDEILALDSALDRLNEVDPRLRQIVELRFFAGLPEREIALLLGVSSRTIERGWLKARLFLLRELEPKIARRDGSHGAPEPDRTREV